MLIFQSVYNFVFLWTAVSINQHSTAACVNLNFIFTILSMQCIWLAVLLMNSDLLYVMHIQLYTFTNMWKNQLPPVLQVEESLFCLKLQAVSTSKLVLHFNRLHSSDSQFYFSSQLTLRWPQHDITQVLVIIT